MRSEIRQAIQSANERMAAAPPPQTIEPSARDVATGAAITLVPAVNLMVRSSMRYDDAAELFRQMYLGAAISCEQGNVTAAADRIGVHRNTFYRRG